MNSSNHKVISKIGNAAVINLFPEFKGRNPKELLVGITDGHPNEVAHKIYANAVFNYLIKHKTIIP